ncbi:MAG TPA: hypothetical protein VFT45_11045 [Longimicrobium sp.]|nr:hypothetical protein [Longimicrobium sp.]
MKTGLMNEIRTLILGAALLALPLAACGGGASAENGGEKGKAAAAGDTGKGGAAKSAQPAINPQDTASRRVGDALARHDSAAADSIAKADSAAAAAGTPVRFQAGEDPRFARQSGWPVNYPRGLPGALLPDKRIVCYYGNPNSTRMGALGEYPREDMLRRLNGEVQKWNQADPQHPVVPCLHMVSVVAQGDPGPSGHYRAQMRDTQVDSMYQMAKSINGVFIIDVQVGTDDIRNIMPRFENFLKRPDIHFAVDPEFYMRDGVLPGRRIGTMHAADINYVSEQLARIVRENNLPPKILVIHRFTRNMVTNTEDIILRPEVQIVMDMDGWGAPWLKRDSYRDYVVRHPVQFTGFKLFYHNDTKKGDPLMSPADLLKLEPKPLYIQYQ